MAKLKSDYAGAGPAIGTEALLRFIDDMNVIRARSFQRKRFRPQQRKDGVVWMQEYDEVIRPSRADTPSPRYSR
jgi:hypothetical protein